MLTDYMRAALKRARYEILSDDGTFYGEIPGFQGVWANSPQLEACREELAEVLEDWVFLRISQNLDLPEIEGMKLMVKEAV